MILMNKIDFLKLFIKAHVCHDSILVSTSEQISLLSIKWKHVPVTRLSDTESTLTEE